MFTRFINSLYSSLSNVKFDLLVWIIIGSFSAIFFITLVCCIFSRKIRAASKRPYICLVNVYAALTLAAFLTNEPLSQSVLAAALFWVGAYLTYGLLCAFTTGKPRQVKQLSVSALPVAVPSVKTARIDSPAAKSSVRIDHAISVTENLLQKNLGKTDRQELEKLKSTLDVLQLKGSLSPTEADILNENFNALLKLMAKYNM